MITVGVPVAGASDEPVYDINDATGSVVESSEGRIVVDIDDARGRVELTPVGFPTGWTFVAGDRVTALLDSMEAYPLVRPERGSPPKLIALNVRREHERVMATLQ